MFNSSKKNSSYPVPPFFSGAIVVTLVVTAICSGGMATWSWADGRNTSLKLVHSWSEFDQLADARGFRPSAIFDGTDQLQLVEADPLADLFHCRPQQGGGYVLFVGAAGALVEFCDQGFDYRGWEVASCGWRDPQRPRGDGGFFRQGAAQGDPETRAVGWVVGEGDPWTESLFIRIQQEKGGFIQDLLFTRVDGKAPTEPPCLRRVTLIQPEDG